VWTQYSAWHSKVLYTIMCWAQLFVWPSVFWAFVSGYVEMKWKLQIFISIHFYITRDKWRLSWSWSYGSWIYNYLCNQCLSPLRLWVRILLMAMCTGCLRFYYESIWITPFLLQSKIARVFHFIRYIILRSSLILCDI
jgi:hypothetical protein